MTPRFADAMILRPLDERPGESSMSFEGNLDDNWAIGPKIHGGVMVALCAKAARQGYGILAHPVAVSANFLSAPDPGPVG